MIKRKRWVTLGDIGERFYCYAVPADLIEDIGTALDRNFYFSSSRTKETEDEFDIPDGVETIRVNCKPEAFARIFNRAMCERQMLKEEPQYGLSEYYYVTEEEARNAKLCEALTSFAGYAVDRIRIINPDDVE